MDSSCRTCKPKGGPSPPDGEICAIYVTRNGECRRPAASHDRCKSVVRAGEDFDQTRFGLRILFQAFADGLAQMVEGGFDERRQRAAIPPLAARGAPPAVHAFAERSQAVEHGVDDIAIGLQVGAAFRGDGVELLAAFGLTR